MAKKYNTPFSLKAVRWIFPRLERIAPFLAHRYFLKIFFTPLKYITPEKELKAQGFAKKETITAAGQQIQIYIWGDEGPYILFVHGWAGRATQFRRFIKPLLAAGFNVIGFDGPAHGNSTGKTTSIQEFEEVFKNIFARYGVPHAMVAHSFGGVATLFAAMNGLPVKKLINIASPTIGDEVIRTYLKAINGSWKTGEFFKAYVKKTQGKTFDEFSSLHFVKHLPKPFHILLVHDENDNEAAIINAEALMRIYPMANLIRTKKLGHTRILKDDEVIRRCVTFIADNASDEHI